jgi:hypothetical protein
LTSCPTSLHQAGAEGAHAQGRAQVEDKGRRLSSIKLKVGPLVELDHEYYVIHWGDNSQDNSSFVNNGTSIQFTHQWTTWGFYKIQASAQDQNNETSEMYETTIAIDVRYVGTLGYLINTDGKDG